MVKILSIFFYSLPISWQIHLKNKISLLYDEAGYGDTLMVGAVAREIKIKYGQKVKVTVNRTKEELLKYNPSVDKTGIHYNGIDLNYHYDKNDTGNKLCENLIDTMCRKAGIQNPSHRVNIYLNEDEIKYASSVLNRLKRPVITIQTTSGLFDNGRKRWPVKYWEDLVFMLTREHYSVVHLGSKGELPVKHVVSLTGKQDIRHSIAIIGAADLHIGVVSSLMHGAAAVNTPAVILYGGFERYSFHGYKNICPIESYTPCSPCIEAYKKVEKCPFKNKCMREIYPEIVFQKALRILKGYEKAAA